MPGDALAQAHLSLPRALSPFHQVMCALILILTNVSLCIVNLYVIEYRRNPHITAVQPYARRAQISAHALNSAEAELRALMSQGTVLPHRISYFVMKHP